MVTCVVEILLVSQVHNDSLKCTCAAGRACYPTFGHAELRGYNALAWGWGETDDDTDSRECGSKQNFHLLKQTKIRRRS